MGNKTLAIIKPDAVQKGHTGDILAMIIKAGFKIKAMKMTHLTKSSAEGFYAIHKERTFFADLVSYMTSGPCIPKKLNYYNLKDVFCKILKLNTISN